MTRAVPTRLRDLPFAAGSATAVLGLDHGGASVDLQFVGYGWCGPVTVWLDDGARCVAVEQAVVVALHAADDAPPIADDVLLEFVVDDGPTPTSVSALLSAFLAAWLPVLPPAGPIVLALCNPHHAWLVPRLIQLAPSRTWFVADGNVDSWADAAPSRLRLHAAAWHHVRPSALEVP